MRIHAQTISQEQAEQLYGHRIGRLCIESDWDSAESILTFAMPSQGDPNKVYIIPVDLITLECRCDCKDWTVRRRSYAGDQCRTLVEALAVQLIDEPDRLPLITRSPLGVCYHLRRIQLMLKRYGRWEMLKDLERCWEDTLSARLAAQLAAKENNPT